jgi:hypothetical protein
VIPILAREQPCGCIVCRCEDEQHCHGCGAKKCGATDCVLKDPNDPRAMYSIPNSHPLARVAKLVEALEYIAKYDADPLFVEAARAAIDEWRKP